MEKKVRIEEIQTRFQEFLKMALNGTDIIIMSNQKAIARLIRIDSEDDSSDEEKWTTDDFDIKLSGDL
jgi:antitoxin (DNA-binding transcriptional repressor) of toxin-antitoxin stability system